MGWTHLLCSFGAAAHCCSHLPQRDACLVHITCVRAEWHACIHAHTSHLPHTVCTKHARTHTHTLQNGLYSTQTNASTTYTPVTRHQTA